MKIKHVFYKILAAKTFSKSLISMAFVLAAYLLQACEKEVMVIAPYADTLQSYYIESTHLGIATADSIDAFVAKVNALTISWPEVKDEPQYPLIVENIRQSLIVFHITINGEWDGLIEIKKE